MSPGQTEGRTTVRLRDERRRSFTGSTGDPERAESGELLVEFPRPGAPSLSKGSEVELELEGATAMLLVGTVDTRIDTPQSRRYRIHVRPAESSELPASGNRRDAFRVRPPVTGPIVVRVQPLDSRNDPLGPAFTSRLRDISTLGIAVILGSEDRSRLKPLQRVRFDFSLPPRNEDDEPVEVRLEGNVRYCRRLGLMTHCGIQIEGERGPELQAMTDHITRYVIRRQIEQLERIRRDDSAA